MTAFLCSQLHIYLINSVETKIISPKGACTERFAMLAFQKKDEMLGDKNEKTISNIISGGHAIQYDRVWKCESTE